MTSPCPASETLATLFVGDRPPSNAAELLKHVAACPSCRDTLAIILPDIETPLRFRPDGASGGIATPKSGTVKNTAQKTIPQPLETALGVFSPAKVAPIPEPVPERLGTNEVVSVLGRGGMGMVLKAIDPALNRFVAVKILFPNLAANEVYRQRFAREARSAAKIGSDHATAVHSVGEDGDAPYIVMEYIAGENLETKLNRDGRLPLPLAVSIARQVAAGLAAAHAQGVVHRDIKPANIMLENVFGPDAKAGEAALIRVKITDFGIAKSAGLSSLTGAQETVGTPEYMSPEQISGEELDHRSDLYSFGIMLYRMVTDQLPFKGKTAVACFTQHLSKEPTPPTGHIPDLPPWLDSLILKLLRKEPTDRYQTALDVVHILDQGYARLIGPSTNPEHKRLAALRSYRILDTEEEQAFDDLAFLASHICGTPMALVSLIDEDRQWFKAKVGLSITQTARNVSFCRYTIQGTTPLVVNNATTDPRFANNPFVVKDPNIRFYAGVPLVDPEGCALGSLCVIDKVPRGLTDEQLAAMNALGRLVMNLLNARREALERKAAESPAPTVDDPGSITIDHRIPTNHKA